MINKTASQKLSSSNMLIWNQELSLTWDDFKGETPKRDLNYVNAETSSGILIQSNSYEYEVPFFQVYATFDKEKSWTITNETSVLHHEQLHFDICKLYARKMRKCFAELMKQKEMNSETYVNLYHELTKQKNDFQNKYDNEVYFSEEKQNHWYKMVAEQLEELDHYALKSIPPIEELFPNE